MRVVSLVPSSTESLLAMDADVIACTKYCEQPLLPHVGGTKNPDIAAIIDLQPDVVVLDRDENRLEDAEELRRSGLELFVSEVTSLDDAVDVVARLGRLVGRGDNLASMSIGTAASTLQASVFVPIWRRPWMSISAATYGGSLLAHLGCRLVTDDASTPYPEVDLDGLAELRPDAVLVPSEPYEFDDGHLDEIRVAAPEAAVVRVDGQDLFWWGTRTPGAIRRLGAALTSAGVIL